MNREIILKLELLELKYEKLKSDIQSGVTSLGQGNISQRKSSDILNDILKSNKAEMCKIRKSDFGD